GAERVEVPLLGIVRRPGADELHDQRREYRHQDEEHDERGRDKGHAVGPQAAPEQLERRTGGDRGLDLEQVGALADTGRFAGEVDASGHYTLPGLTMPNGVRRPGSYSSPLGDPAEPGPPEERQPSCVRIRSSERRIRRETCICEMPTRSAICVWVSPSSNRMRRISRSRSGSAASAGSSEVRSSVRSYSSSSWPIVSIGSSSSSPPGPAESDSGA